MDNNPRDAQSTELSVLQHASMLIWVKWILWPTTLSFQQRSWTGMDYRQANWTLLCSQSKQISNQEEHPKHHLAVVGRLHELRTNLSWVWSTSLSVPLWFLRLPEKCECLLVRQSSSSTSHQRNPTVMYHQDRGYDFDIHLWECDKLHHLCNCWWHRSIACSLLLPQALQKYLDQDDSRGKPA